MKNIVKSLLHSLLEKVMVHPLKGRKQSPEHIAARAAALRGRPGNPGSGRPANTPAVLWSKVDRRGPDECWPWLGWRTELGYGRTQIKGKAYYAHRVIYDLANPGKISLARPSEDECICHRCDNPICCNPAHLFLGNHQENMDDKVKKGRSPDFRGHRAPRSKLTNEDVFWMRVQKKYGATKKALAMLYEVSEATVSGACYGRHYQDVPQ